MAIHDEARPSAGSGRELLGWVILVLGVGALQLPALGRMAMQGIDIIEFELMFTTQEALRQTAQLGADGLAAARQQLYIDFAYLVLYGTALWKAGRLLAARAARRGQGALARLATMAGWAAALAALCDAVENCALLLVTFGQTGQPWPAIASGYAAAKFTLLAVAALVLLVGYAATLTRRPAV